MKNDNRKMRLLKRFKQYLASKGYKFKSESVHIIGHTLRAEIIGNVNPKHFTFVKNPKKPFYGVTVVDVNTIHQELDSITDNFFVDIITSKDWKSL